MSIDAGTSLAIRKCSLLIPPACSYDTCFAHFAVLSVSSSSSNDSSSIQRRLTCKEIVRPQSSMAFLRTVVAVERVYACLLDTVQLTEGGLLVTGEAVQEAVKV